MLHSPTAPVTQRPAHPSHHTHITPVTVRHSQSPTAPLASLLSRITLQATFCGLPPVRCRCKHTPSRTQRITRTQKHNSPSARGGVGPATLTASRACRQVRTHRHTLMRPGTKGHTPVKHARGLPGGKTLTESASHVLGFRMAPTDALGGQDSGGPSRLAQPGQVPAVSSLSLPREGAGPRLRDWRRSVPSVPAPAHSEPSPPPSGCGLHFPEAPGGVV